MSAGQAGATHFRSVLHLDDVSIFYKSLYQELVVKQGFSGSIVQRNGNFVEKVTSDQDFINSKARQNDLMALTRKITVLPYIDHITGSSIYMEYVDGQEGLTKLNARQTGKALRILHEQQGYPHPCMTGVNWLIEIANDNLAHMNLSQRISSEVTSEYPNDALIHSEPVQLIEKKDGSVVFIDFEGIGMGSRYQDLGFIYWHALNTDQLGVFSAFINGYQSGTVPIDLQRVKQLAGIISLAYVGFALAYAGLADAEKRLQLGISLFGETNH